MARKRHLTKAPITEALIDLRVILPSDFDAQEFSKLSDQLSAKYPKKEPRKLVSGSFGVREGKPFTGPTEYKGIDGFYYKSEDERNIVQFRSDGFTFNHLYPYTKWESVITEAKNMWELYCSLAKPEIISRVAVRYINRLELPLPIEFERYLTAPPKIPDSLPQELSGFLTRILISEAGITANIVQSLDSSTKPDHGVIILDIDVFEVKKSGFDKENVWSEFEQLRKFKNRIFFKSITEETARLYK